MIYSKNIFVSFLILLCLLQVGTHMVNASEEDSLLTRLPEAHDTAKVDIYNRLYWITIYHDHDKAQEYAFQGMQLAEDLGYLAGKHGLLICIAHMYSLEGNAEKELEYKMDALALSEDLSPFDQALSYFTMGESYRNYRNGELAMDYLNKALEMSKLVGSKWIEAKSLGEIGSLLWAQKDTLNAISNIKQAIFLLDSLDATQSSSWTHTVLAGIYQDQQLWEASIQEYEQAIALFHIHNNQLGAYQSHNKLGEIARSRGNYAEAIEYFHLAMNDLRDPDEHQQKIPENAYYLAATYLEWGKVDSALTEITLCTEKLEKPTTDQLAEDAYALQARIYEAIGDYQSAYLSASLGNQFARESYQNLLQKELDDLELIYRIDRQNRENEILKQEMLLERRKQQSALLVVGILFTLILGVVSGAAYFSKQKLSTALMLSNQKIKQQKEDLILANEQLAHQNKTLADTNKEKENAIRIVTHDLKAPLDRIAGLISLLRISQEERSSKEAVYLDKMQQVVNEGGQTISRLLDMRALGENKVVPQIHPVQLNTHLGKVVDKFQQLASRKKIIIVYQPDEKENLLIYTDAFYLDRILENLISNAVKFSFADSKVYVRCGRKGEQIFVEIEDEGPGIKENEQDKLFQNYQRLSSRPTGGESSTGLGLSLSQSIAIKLGGKISFSNASKHGAIFRLTLPTGSKPSART